MSRKLIYFIVVILLISIPTNVINTNISNNTNNFASPNNKVISRSDLILDNGLIHVKMNGTLMNSPVGYIFSEVTSSQYNVKIDPDYPDDSRDFASCSGGQDGDVSYAAYDMNIFENLKYHDAIGYRIITNRSTSQYKAQWNVTIILPNNKSYFIVHVDLKNIDTKSVLIDENPGHIHDGVNILTEIRAQLGSGTFPDSTSNDKLYIEGHGDVPFTGTTYWHYYYTDSQRPFYTMYDGNSGDAMTVGYLRGTTSAHQIVYDYRLTSSSKVDGHVDFTVGEATIPVGQTYSYDFFVAIHNKNSQDGRTLYDIIKSEYQQYLQPEEEITHDWVYIDQNNQLWVNTSKYEWRITNDSYLIYKTGTEITNASIYPDVLKQTVDIKETGYYHEKYFTDMQILYKDNNSAKIYLERLLSHRLSNGTYEYVRLRMNFTVYRDSGLIKIDSYFYNPENKFLYTYAFQMQQIPGGDEVNDYYYYSGASSEASFPYSSWDDILPSETVPYKNMMYVTMYDKVKMQGIALFANYAEHGDHWTDVHYGSVMEVHGVVYAQYNKLILYLNTTYPITYYIYIYTTDDSIPYKPVEDMIDQIAASNPSDTNPPMITHVTDAPEYVRAGDSLQVNATVADDVSVDKVLLEYWYNAGVHTYLTMTNVGGDNFSAAITNLQEATLYYRIYANDTSGNSRTSETYNKTVYPITLPSNQWFNVTYTVSPSTFEVGDTIQIDYTINHGYPLSSVYASSSETIIDQYFISDNVYHVVATINNPVSNFTLHMTDVFGYSDTHQLTLHANVDNDPPIIESVSDTPDYVRVGDVLNITARVSDDQGIKIVQLKYWYETHNATVVNMNNDTGEWTYQIHITYAEMLYYQIIVNDTSDNMVISQVYTKHVYPENLTSEQNFVVNYIYEPEVFKINDTIILTVNITHGYPISALEFYSTEVIISVNRSLDNITLIASLEIRNDNPNISIFIMDVFGNTHTEYIYLHTNTDLSGPTIINTTHEPYYVLDNMTLRIISEITDESNVSRAICSVEINGTVYNYTMIHSIDINTQYYCEIHGFNGTGYIKYKIIAYDTFNNMAETGWNSFYVYPHELPQSPWFNITYIISPQNISIGEDGVINITVEHVYPLSVIIVNVNNSTETYYISNTTNAQISYQIHVSAQLLNISITARDVFGYSSTVNSTYDVLADHEPPVISIFLEFPDPAPNGTLIIYANISDSSGIRNVTLRYGYDTNGSGPTYETIFRYESNRYIAEITIYNNRTFYFTIIATDIYGNIGTLYYNNTFGDFEAPNVTTNIPEYTYIEIPVYNITANDLTNISRIEVYYSTDNETWIYVDANLYSGTKDTYMFVLHRFEINTTIWFNITVYDVYGNFRNIKRRTIIAENEDPTITYLLKVPDPPLSNESVLVFFRASDNFGIQKVILQYSTDMHTWYQIELTENNSIYSGEIPAYPVNTTVYFKAIAFDWFNNTAQTQIYSFTFEEPGNQTAPDSNDASDNIIDQIRNILLEHFTEFVTFGELMATVFVILMIIRKSRKPRYIYPHH